MEHYILEAQAWINNAIDTLRSAQMHVETEDQEELIQEQIDELEIIESDVADLVDEL